jgi:hypothetical protein
MFRNALRQSTRAVGAISATGRVAVSSISVNPNRAQFHPNLFENNLNGFDKVLGSPIEKF